MTYFKTRLTNCVGAIEEMYLNKIAGQIFTYAYTSFRIISLRINIHYIIYSERIEIDKLFFKKKICKMVSNNFYFMENDIYIYS